MIGLDIRVNSEHFEDLLPEMLNKIDLLKYQWQIIQDQIIYYENDRIMQGIFNADFLSGEEFEKCIARKGYYFIFVDLKAYKARSKIIDIETFEDFMNSDCELVFMCYDTVYIEIYCKDMEILNIIYDNCTNNNFDKVQYISCDEAAGKRLIAF